MQGNLFLIPPVLKATLITSDLIDYLVFKNLAAGFGSYTLYALLIHYVLAELSVFSLLYLELLCNRTPQCLPFTAAWWCDSVVNPSVKFILKVALQTKLYCYRRDRSMTINILKLRDPSHLLNKSGHNRAVKHVIWKSEDIFHKLYIPMFHLHTSTQTPKS